MFPEISLHWENSSVADASLSQIEFQIQFMAIELKVKSIDEVLQQLAQFKEITANEKKLLQSLRPFPAPFQLTRCVSGSPYDWTLEWRIPGLDRPLGLAYGPKNGLFVELLQSQDFSYDQVGQVAEYMFKTAVPLAQITGLVVRRLREMLPHVGQSCGRICIKEHIFTVRSDARLQHTQSGKVYTIEEVVKLVK